MRSEIRLLVLPLLLVLLACTEDKAPTPAAQAVAPDAVLAGLDADGRIQRILDGAEANQREHIPMFLELMKDRSQIAFKVSVDTGAPFGLAASEFKVTGEDTRPMERVAAILALQKLKVQEALPDLLLALDDRHPVVVNHAALALVGLGSRAGIPYLLAHAQGKVLATGAFMASPAFAGETADSILRNLTGADAGYSADAGFAVKQEAVARWRTLLAEREKTERPFVGEGKAYMQGDDAATDRRISFFVDTVGGMQFLYHEQARRMLQRLGNSALPFVRDGIERSRSAANPTLRAGLAQVLGAITHSNSEAMLVELFHDADLTVAERAAESLGQQGGTTGSVAVLRNALADARLRLAALAALGRCAALGTPVIEAFVATDADSAAMRTLALFESTRGQQAREGVLSQLRADSLPQRAQAIAVVKRTLNADGGYAANADKAARDAAIERIKEVLR